MRRSSGWHRRLQRCLHERRWRQRRRRLLAPAQPRRRGFVHARASLLAQRASGGNAGATCTPLRQLCTLAGASPPAVAATLPPALPRRCRLPAACAACAAPPSRPTPPTCASTASAHKWTSRRASRSRCGGNVSQRLPERHTLCFLLLGSWLLHQLALFLRICQGVQSPTSPTCRLPSHDRSRCCGARAAAATCSRPSTGSRQTWVRRAGQTWRPLPATAGAADGDRPARLQQQGDCKRRSSRRPGALPLQAVPAGEAAAAPVGAAGRVSCSRAHGTQVPLDIYALAALPPFLQSPRSC